MRWMILWVLFVAACRPAPTPCVSSSTCGQGLECLANHCAAQGSDPVASESQRHVLSPSAIGFVSAHRAATGSGLPPVVSFGSRVEGATAWYLDFAPSWSAAAEIDRAFLVLSPSLDSPPATRDTRLAAWRVAEPWTMADLTWHDQPAREPPKSVGIARGAPPQVVRMDVTRIVQYWQHHPQHRHGLVVEAAAGDGHGVAFTTGAAGGNSPALEVYVREETR